MNASHAALIAVAGLGATAALAVPHQAHARTALEPVLQPLHMPVNGQTGTLAAVSPTDVRPVDASPIAGNAEQPTRAASELRALSALSRLFHEPVFDRERWERAASALASDLDHRDVVRLAETSADLGIDRVLAAAALIAHAEGDDFDGLLPPTALAALRTAWSGAVGPERSSAAVRSLLALGDVSDRRGILAELHAPDVDRRSRASWGLQGSGGVKLVSELTDELGSLRAENDDTAALQAVTALRSVVAQTTDWTPDLRRSVELQMREVLEEEDASSEMHVRATAVLASLL